MPQKGTLGLKGPGTTTTTLREVHMRTRTFLVRAGMALVLIAAGLLFAAPWRTAAADDDDGGDPRVRRGFEITPVPPDLKGKDRELVGLGSYLVNAVAGCNDCHTNPPYAPGHNPFMGQPKEFNAATYLAGGTKFGSFVSKNLTPDNGKPAGLTREEF